MSGGLVMTKDASVERVVIPAERVDERLVARACGRLADLRELVVACRRVRVPITGDLLPLAWIGAELGELCDEVERRCESLSAALEAAGVRL